MLRFATPHNPIRLLLVCLLLLGLAVGCDDDKKPAAGGTSATAAKGAAPQAATKPLVELQAPPEVVLFGGTDDLQKLLTDVQKLAGGISPMAAMPPDQVKKQLHTVLKLKSADVLDFAKPARFVVADPKKKEDRIALVLGTAGKDKLVAALPADKKENDAGNQYAWTTQNNKTAYLNFLGDTAVLSPDKDMYPAHRGFIAQVAKAKLPAPVAVVGSAVNAVKLYGADIDQGLKQAKQSMEQAGKAGGAPGGAGMQAAQLQGISAMLDWLAGAVKELDKVVLTAKLPADGALVSLQLFAKKGTEVEKAFKLLGTRPFKLLSKLPKDASALFAMSLDPDAGGELTRKLVTWSLSMGLGGQEPPKKYVDGMNDYWKATTGEYVLAAHPDLDKGMTISGLMGIRDADKALAAMKLIGEMYADPAVTDSYKKMGMQISYQPEAYKIGDMPVATTEVNMGAAGAALGPLLPMLQEIMNTHNGVSKELGYIAYGKNGKKTIQAYVDDKITAGLDQEPGVARAVKNAAPNSFFLMYLAPMQIAKTLDLGGQNPLKEKLASVPDAKTGLCLSAGATDGVVQVTLDVPTEQAQQVAQLVMLAQQLRPGGM